MREIEVGQIWLDKHGVWNADYDGEMVYVVCSKDGNEPWVCMCFQEWKYGAYKRMFEEADLNKLIYIGKLSELLNRIAKLEDDLIMTREEYT